MPKLTSKTLQVDPEYYAQRDIEFVDPKTRLFTLLDAMLCPHKDGDPLEGALLRELDVLPPDAVWDADVADLTRKKLAVRGLPYLGTKNHSMVASQRFLLCEMAVKDPEVRLHLQQWCVRRAVLESPLGVALAQVSALFQNKERVFQEACGYAPRLWERRIHLALCSPTRSWFDSRTPYLQSACFADMLFGLCFEDMVHPLLGHAAQAWKAGRLRLVGSDVVLPLSMYYVWSGEMPKAEECLARAKPATGESVFFCFALGFLQFFQGSKECLQTLEKGFEHYKKENGIRNAVHFGLNIGLIRNLSLFLYGEGPDVAGMNDDLDALLKMKMESLDELFFGKRGFCGLRALSHLSSGTPSQGKALLKSCQKKGVRDGNAFSSLLYLGALLHFGLAGKKDIEEMRVWYQRSADLPLMRRCFSDLLFACTAGAERDAYARSADDPFSGVPNFAQLVDETPPWEIQLGALEDIFYGNGEEDGEEGKKREMRLVWEVDAKQDALIPIEQVRHAAGSWSRGRTVALKRLVTEGHPAATYLDFRIISRIESLQESYQRVYRLSLHAACEDLEGHPFVFARRGGELEPLNVRKEQVELFLKEQKKDYVLALAVPELSASVDAGNLTPCFEKGNELVVYHLSKHDAKVVQMLGKDGLAVPKKASSRLFAMMRGKNALPMQADIKAEVVQANPYPVLQLEQVAGATFMANIGVRPFTSHGTPFFPVGYGPKEPISALPLVEGETTPQGGRSALGKGAPSVLSRPVRARRDFDREGVALMELAADCPALEANLEGLSWQSEDLESVVSLLEQLKNSRVPNSVEWPKGGGLKFRRTVQASDVSMSVQKGSGQDWFSVSGGIRIDEKRFLSVKQVLDSLTGSRFVSLGDGEYIALTEDLRRKLKRLQFVGEPRKDSLKVSSVAVGALEGIFEGMQVKEDGQWTQILSRMKEAFAVEPEVPSLLQAELREYQKEGYQWMQRLAVWGMGACLADDMGLGKTVQTIAVLLNQAAKGPCLIVAPTSVCSNWEIEIARFAPSLRTRRLGGGDRLSVVQSLGRNDVLVVGYGLLVNAGAELASVRWSMAVFDEAQAIKNSTTKRAKAGGNISADFRVALTGTPIENRIDDLWSLFNIINPGLLGSWESFKRRFGNIVPGSGGNKALKSLVRPFLLRRLKSSVLDELPSRTEQTVVIEPNEKEHVFYESLRQRCVENLERSDKASRRFEILAALSRLRMTCCHPGLADADMKSMEKESSKTEYFVGLVEDLIANGHKILAFSQFTSYLTMVQSALEKRGVSCKYLDGTTPEKERMARVEAFQAGEGDVFLLSLKAGGTGINLTAADYVVHLDPWWNPAVEDQASDRAHRIGQKRPVTVYRLVMAQSVEEKILALHAAKRELAADFLEGTETSVKSLSEDDLLELLQA